MKKRTNKKAEYDLETRRAALSPLAPLDSEVVRSIRASVTGETLHQYEKRLREIGVEF
tara:strand:+ start:480 stop:653 length:174 start_codon:yes stop_codon:yes gene_type:complete